MAPRTKSPFRRLSLAIEKVTGIDKLTKKKQPKKSVSFGETILKQVKEIERIPEEERAGYWYSHREMSMYMDTESFREGMNDKTTECSAASAIQAKKHVDKIIQMCRLQLNRSDGEWTDSMAKELGKACIGGSMISVNEAAKRAKDIYREVYDLKVTRRESILAKRAQRNSMAVPRLPRRNHTFDDGPSAGRRRPNTSPRRTTLPPKAFIGLEER